MRPKTMHGVQARSIRESDLTRENAPIKRNLSSILCYDYFSENTAGKAGIGRFGYLAFMVLRLQQIEPRSVTITQCGAQATFSSVDIGSAVFSWTDGICFGNAVNEKIGSVGVNGWSGSFGIVATVGGYGAGTLTSLQDYSINAVLSKCSVQYGQPFNWAPNTDTRLNFRSRGA